MIVLLISLGRVVSSTEMVFEQEYCVVGNDCILNDLFLTGNFSFVGDIMNVTIINQEVVGQLSVIGNISADYFIGDGSLLIGITNTFWNIINFTEQYNLRLNRFGNENFTERYDLRGDRWGAENLTSVGTINATKYEDSSLVLHLQFNNNANDSSQYGNDGNPVEADLSKDVVEFEGINENYIRIEDSDTLDITDDLTIEAWINSKDNVGRHIIVAKDEIVVTVNGNVYGMLVRDSKIRFTIGDGSVEDQQISTQSINENQWYHVVGRADNSNVCIFINGVLDGCQVRDVTTIQTTARWLGIGTNPRSIDMGTTNDWNFSGRIDEVKIYNRALSSNEIQREYNKQNKNYGHFNNIEVKDLNVTNTLNIEGESTFKDNIHIKDNIKTYRGDADDVSVEFNETDLNFLAEVGTPNFNFDEGTLVIDTGNNRVGIGTTTPQTLLNLLDASNPTIRIGENLNVAYGVVAWRSSANSMRIGNECTDPACNGLILRTNAADRLTIERLGNVGIGTITPAEKLTVIGNASFTRNVTASNIWNTQLLSLHTDAIQCVQSSGLFQNITFNDTTKTKVGSISHNPIGITNATITIGTDGFYDMDYLIQIIDSSASPNSHVLGRITKNDVEINGSLEEYDPTRQNTDGEIQGGIIEPLNAGDQISVQFTSDDTTVCMDTDKTFGIHKDTATLKIRKVGNLIS